MEENEVELEIKKYNNNNDRVRRKKRNYKSFDTYIRRVMDNINERRGIKEETIKVIDSFIYDMVDRLMRAGDTLMKSSKGKTIDDSTIKLSIKMVFPSELANYAISEGYKAVSRYNKSKKDDSANGAGKKISVKERAGIIFPPSRFENIMREIDPVKRISKEASIFLAASIEYCVEELLEGANDVETEKTKRIKPRDIYIAIERDKDLSDLVGSSVIIPNSGVIPNINEALYNKKTSGSKKKE